MILIADSGSTKTDWVLLEGNLVVHREHTQGINPFHQDRSVIAAVLSQELVSMHSYTAKSNELTICFYGSGVRKELEPVMRGLLSDAFPNAVNVEAHGDLLGAAISVCGSQPGQACILGTGANSCLFDGKAIVQNTPPLGYILGDEGSGAVLGRLFLNALLKGFLPSSLREQFFSQLGMCEADVIDRVYRQPMANRWLASLSPFIYNHRDYPAVHDIIIDNFRSFFRRNLVQYGRRDLPVGAVGSVAWFYQDELSEAANAEGFTIGRVEQSPIDGLINYYSNYEG